MWSTISSSLWILTQDIEEGSDVIYHFLLTAEACTQLTHHVIGFYDVYCIAMVVVMTESGPASMRRYDVTFNHCVVSKAFVSKQFEFLASWKKSYFWAYLKQTGKKIISQVLLSPLGYTVYLAYYVMSLSPITTWENKWVKGSVPFWPERPGFTIDVNPRNAWMQMIKQGDLPLQDINRSHKNVMLSKT